MAIGRSTIVINRQPLLNAAVEVTVDDGLKAVVLGLAAQVLALEGKTMRITRAGAGYEPAR